MQKIKFNARDLFLYFWLTRAPDSLRPMAGGISPLLSSLGGETLALYAQLLHSNYKYKYAVLAYDASQAIFHFRYV
jgi:hypothetical protein